MKEKRWLKWCLLFMLTLLVAMPAVGTREVQAATKKGSCGDSATYEYNSSNSTLKISGSGTVEYSDDWDSFYTSVKKVVIGNKITSIGDSAFQQFSSLKSVTFGSKVKTIGSAAFFGCTKLQSVTFGNKLTTIGSTAFSGCDKLTNVSLPSSLKEIGAYAFSYGGLKKITIPKNVTSIEPSAFCGCDSLKKITVASGNTAYSARDGVLYNKSKTELIAYPGGKSGTTFTIPDSVVTIWQHSFAYNNKLKTVKIGSKVTTIEFGAFECSALTSITIPKNVIIIGSYAFSACTKLKTVKIGTGVKNIYEGAFSYCTSLKTVTFKGSAPEFEIPDEEEYGEYYESYQVFSGTSVTIRYPSSKKSSWTASLRKKLKASTKSGGGSLKFKAY